MTPKQAVKQPEKPNLTDYDQEVELTPEEKEQALKEALTAKQAKVAMERYSQKLKNPPPVPKLSAESYLAKCLMKFEVETGRQFIVDDFNKPILEKLSLYFTGDERAITEHQMSLRKGLLFMGNVGCGKTTLLRLFALNQQNSYHVISCRMVAAEFSRGGYKAIERFCYPASPAAINPFQQPEWGYCFDDLGTETEKANFGNRSNTMEEILLNRYDQHDLLAGKTHITTNLDGNEIEQYYGERVRSRFHEMFNTVVFPTQTPDRRK